MKISDVPLKGDGSCGAVADRLACQSIPEPRCKGGSHFCDRGNDNSANFPYVSGVPPTKRDYSRMMMFVSVHLALVLLLCCTFWVPGGGDEWYYRLIFASCSVLEALLRVVVATWWFQSASVKLALVFMEIDLVTLTLVGLGWLIIPSVASVSLQYKLKNPESGVTLLDSLGVIAQTVTLRETCKVIGFLIPLAFKQIRCSSHLLFAGATAGALNLLYSDIISGFKPEESTLGHVIVIGLMLALLYTLWTSMGAAILCQIKMNRISIYWCPMVLIVPVVFHAMYLVAIFGQGFGWQWAIISVAYWMVSGVALKLMLTGVMPAPDSNKSAFVSSASTAV